MGVAQNEDATGARELWRNFFDDEIKDYEDGSINQAVPIVIRDIVMPDSVSEAEIEKAALQLDEYNESILLVYDFLSPIMGIVRLIPYDDERQDRLVQLLKHLQEIPKTGPEHTEELSVNLERQWNNRFRDLRPAIYGDLSELSEAAIFQKKSGNWINYSAFKARTLAAGVCTDYDDWSFKAPNWDIPIGLAWRDNTGRSDACDECELMVAAQYILIAGEAIKSDLAKDGRLDIYKEWMEGFRMATTWEDGLKETTKLAVKQAYEKMVSLWPGDVSGDEEQVTKDTTESGVETTKAEDQPEQVAKDTTESGVEAPDVEDQPEQDAKETTEPGVEAPNVQEQPEQDAKETTESGVEAPDVEDQPEQATKETTESGVKAPNVEEQLEQVAKETT